MNKKNWLLLTVLAAIMLVLAACGGGDKSGEKSNQKEKVDTSKFPLQTTNKDESIKGGTLKVALQSDAPFKGLFLYEVYEDAYDAEILSYTSNSIFTTKEDFLIDNDGLAKLDVDTDAKKATIKIGRAHV